MATSTTVKVDGIYKTTDAKGNVSYSQTPPPDAVSTEQCDANASSSAATAVDAPYTSNKCKGLIYANPNAHADAKSKIEKAQKISKIPGYLEAYNNAQFAKARLVPGAGNGVASVVGAYGKASKVLETPSAIPITGNILTNSERTKTAIEATKAAEKGQAVLNASGKAPTAAAGAAAGRVLGAGLGVFIEALNPVVFSTGAILIMRKQASELGGDQEIEIRSLLGTEPAKANQLLKAAGKSGI